MASRYKPESSPRLKPLLVVLALTTVAMLIVATSASGGPSRFPVGGGKAFAAGRDFVQFAFSAHNGAHGASGHITLNWPAGRSQPRSRHGQLLANVTCL